MRPCRRSCPKARGPPSPLLTHWQRQRRSCMPLSSGRPGIAVKSSRNLLPCQVEPLVVCSSLISTGRRWRARCSLQRAPSIWPHSAPWTRASLAGRVCSCRTTSTAHPIAWGPRASSTCAAPTSARPSSSASSTGSTHPRLRPRTSPSCSPRCAARTRSPDWCSRSSTPLHMPAKAVWHCMASPSRSGCTVPSPTSVPGPAPRTLQAHAERRCPMPSATSSRSPSLSSYWLPRRSCLQSCVRRRWRCWCRRHP
mmetsp:Transcript_147283/g.410277  ORF Transcript_147283/g.410277 Transcript_147283/m.410277 type:complete len:253 (+) Transcript_147283:1203-1961(+)